MAVSVDGSITGRNPGLGDGSVLHDWYWDDDTPGTVIPGFRLCEATRFIDPFAKRVAAVIAGLVDGIVVDQVPVSPGAGRRLEDTDRFSSE